MQPGVRLVVTVSVVVVVGGVVVVVTVVVEVVVVVVVTEVVSVVVVAVVVVVKIVVVPVSKPTKLLRVKPLGLGPSADPQTNTNRKTRLAGFLLKKRRTLPNRLRFMPEETLNCI